MNPYHDAKGRFAGRSANSMPTKKELSTFHTRSRMATLAISGMRGTVGEFETAGRTGSLVHVNKAHLRSSAELKGLGLSMKKLRSAGMFRMNRPKTKVYRTRP